MAKEQVIRMVTDQVMTVMTDLLDNPDAVPVGISARHVHLTREHVQTLFGRGYRLTVMKNLSQPGQFAAAETVEIAGSKGNIAKLRILGPERPDSQVEIPFSDGRRLGIVPPVRTSGDLKGTPGILIKGPAGVVRLESGVIVADRHIHMSPDDAKWFGVRHLDIVKARIDGPKGGIIDQITVRVNRAYRLDLHLDTDDANTFLISQGQKITLLI